MTDDKNEPDERVIDSSITFMPMEQQAVMWRGIAPPGMRRTRDNNQGLLADKEKGM